MNRKRGRRLDLLTDLSILLAIVAVCRGAHVVYQLFYHQLSVDDIDLDVYRMGGDALRHGLALYDLKLAGTNLPFTYTPFAAIVFMPLSLLDHNASVAVFTSISLLALLRVCWIAARETRRRAGGDWPIGLIAFPLFLLALDLEPIFETLGFGQVNLVILWLVFEDLLRRKPNKLGGAALGIATGIKLVPGLFIVFLFVTKRTREALTASAATLGTILLGFAMTPSEAARYWGGVAYDPTRMGEVFYVANQSVNGAIFRVVQPDGSRPLWILASIPIVLVCLWTGRRLWQQDARLLATCTVGLGGLLISPVSWSHHWVWFVPILGAFLDPKIAPRLLRMAALGTTFVVSTTMFTWGDKRGLIWQAPHGDRAERTLSTWDRFIASSYVWLGLALVAVAVYVSFRLAREERHALDELDQLDGELDGVALDADEPTDEVDGLESDDDAETVKV